MGFYEEIKDINVSLTQPLTVNKPKAIIKEKRSRSLSLSVNKPNCVSTNFKYGRLTFPSRFTCLDNCNVNEAQPDSVKSIFVQEKSKYLSEFLALNFIANLPFSKFIGLNV